MPMFESARRDDHVAAAEQRGVAREAAAGGDADQRHQPREPRRSSWNARQSRPATPDAVGVAGAAAAALGEEHDRQAPALGELEQAVLLAVVLLALRAGEHGVVVRHQHAARGASRRTAPPFTRPMPATRPSAGVRAIRSSSVRRRRCAAITSGPYSTKVPGSHEIVDVLARGALAGLAPARDRVGARRVERRARGARAPRRGRGGCVEIDALRRASMRAIATSAASMHDEHVALEHRVAAPTTASRARRRRRGARSRAPSSSLPSRAAAGRARTRSPSRTSIETIVPCSGARTAISAVRRRARSPRGATRSPCSLLAVGEHGERIARVDARAGERARRRRRGRVEKSRSRRGVARAATSSRGVLLDEARVHAAGARAPGCASSALQEARGWSRRPRCGTRASARLRARAARRRSRRDAECTISFASSESKRGFVRVAGVAARVDAHARAGRRLERARACRPTAAAMPSAPIVSMLTRSWIAKPRGAGDAAPARGRARRACARAASSSCACTRSMPGHLLGDRVLDLQARVRLDERERASSPSGVASTRNSNVPRLVVARGLGRAARPRRACARAGAVASHGLGAISTSFWWRRCSAALALPQVDDAARCRRRRSAPRRGARAAAAARRRRRRCRTRRAPRSGSARTRRRARSARAHDAHAAAAAARDRLDHHRAARAERAGTRAPRRAWSARPCRGSTGTPQRCASARARALSPNSSSISGRGPDEA